MELQNFAYTGNQITRTAYGSNLSQTVKDRYGNDVVTLTAEKYNNSATLDFAPVLRTMFEDTTQLLDVAQHTFKDYNLQVEAIVSSTTYILVRGVSQKAGIKAEAFKFLTNMPMLRHYAGYPLTISHVIENDTRTYWGVKINEDYMESNEALISLAGVLKSHSTTDISTNPNTVTHVSAIYTHSDPYYYAGYFPDHDPDFPYKWVLNSQYVMWTADRDPQVGDNIFTNYGSAYKIEQIDTVSTNKPMEGELALMNDGVKRDSIQVKEITTPAHPFYVRWINNLGGWDYFMFACMQKTTGQLTANDQYEKLERTVTRYSRYGQRSTFNKAATKDVEVSTGVIDRQTLESVVECAYSPLVQLYDEETGLWYEIQPKTDKWPLMADQPTGEMIFTFELPTPQLNK